jgi:hypothetical protein
MDRTHDGVVLWMKKEKTGSIVGYEPVNKRILVIRIDAKPRVITVVQVGLYASTSNACEEEVDNFYEKLHTVIGNTHKKDVLLKMGDFKPKLGKRMNKREAVGMYGFGEFNRIGEQLEEFCQDHSLIEQNNCFEKHPRSLYTRTSPNLKVRNQIHYV